MSGSSRCLYQNRFAGFLRESSNSIFGILNDRYHGEARTSTREAWKEEISFLKRVLPKLSEQDGQIIFEYDIPRLGKRIDVVLLLRDNDHLGSQR